MLGKNLFHGMFTTLALQFGLSSFNFTEMRQVPAFDLFVTTLVITIIFCIGDMGGEILKRKFEEASEKGKIKQGE